MSEAQSAKLQERGGWAAVPYATSALRFFAKQRDIPVLVSTTREEVSAALEEKRVPLPVPLESFDRALLSLKELFVLMQPALDVAKAKDSKTVVAVEGDHRAGRDLVRDDPVAEAERVKRDVLRMMEKRCKFPRISTMATEKVNTLFSDVLLGNYVNLGLFVRLDINQINTEASELSTLSLVDGPGR